ncbi:MAG TPA: TraB/GumN family protein [Brevundimonas sp.]|nr:TraB/GumN family protein [Brevundimonas sp.]
MPYSRRLNNLRLLVARGLAALALATAGVAHAEPALWVVKDDDSTLYLFGAIHVLKPDADWRSPRFDAAFYSAAHLVLEVENPEDQAALMPLIQQHGLSPDRPLSALLSPEDLARLDDAARSLGLTATQLDPMRPWLASLSLSVAPLARAGYQPASGVEPILRAHAQSGGVPISGLETLDQQVRLLAGFPEDGQLAYLRRTLGDYASGAAALDRLVAAWLAGDVDEIAAIGVGSMRDAGERVYQALLVERNRAWAEQILTMLEGSGIAFIAVGALHLAGEDSLQVMLERRDVRVERLH